MTVTGLRSEVSQLHDMLNFSFLFRAFRHNNIHKSKAKENVTCKKRLFNARKFYCSAVASIVLGFLL